jgi:hypothetical protein
MGILRRFVRLISTWFDKLNGSDAGFNGHVISVSSYAAYHRLTRRGGLFKGALWWLPCLDRRAYRVPRRKGRLWLQANGHWTSTNSVVQVLAPQSLPLFQGEDLGHCQVRHTYQYQLYKQKVATYNGIWCAWQILTQTPNTNLTWAWKFRNALKFLSNKSVSN